MKKIIYILETTTICGGVKVVFEHAKHLIKKGINTEVVSKQPYPDWINFKVPFRQINSCEDVFIEKNVIFILTFFEHILIAEKNKVLDRCIHFCQGYEGDYREAERFLKDIERAYSIPIKRITVSDRLSDYIYSKFKVPAYSIGQAIDHSMFYPSKDIPSYPPYKILVMGSFFNSVKRIKDALLCAAKLKKELPIELIRISLSDSEEIEKKICQIDRYLKFLTPDRVADTIRDSHLLIVPSSKGEGFGLPVIEAMASGVPVVMTNIPSFKHITKNKYLIPLIEIGDIDNMAYVAKEILKNKKKYMDARERGICIAREYSYDRVVEGLVDFVINNW